MHIPIYQINMNLEYRRGKSFSFIISLHANLNQKQTMEQIGLILSLLVSGLPFSIPSNSVQFLNNKTRWFELTTGTFSI